MSHLRQELCIRGLGLTLPSGFTVKSHKHGWAQLIYTIRGVITAASDSAAWVIPPMRALLVGAGVWHSIHTSGAVMMRTLYFRPDVSPSIDTSCAVIAVSPLLRELILSIVGSGGLNQGESDEARLKLLLHLLTVLPERPLELPMPLDCRARSVAKRIISDVGAAGTLQELARGSGASTRTIERLFLDQTGLTFGRWRQQARFLEALRLLGLGTPVSSVATKIGYHSTSAFVAAFRRAFGTTPARYFERAGQLGSL